VTFSEIVKGKPSSRLGFGCAPMLGRVDAEMAERSIRAALDKGINHFDVAPSYGYGQAEAFLGRILGSNASDCVIVTKFGYRATVLAGIASPFKPLMQRMVARGNAAGESKLTATETRSRLNDLLIRPVPLGAAALRRSVERSLKRLRVDCLDGICLHEPCGVPQCIDDLIEEVTRMQSRGILRSFGVSARHDIVTQFCEAGVPIDFEQVELPVSVPGIQAALAEQRHRRVFYSVVRNFPFEEMGQPASDKSSALRWLFKHDASCIGLCSMFAPEILASSLGALEGDR
jgi:aryl-alcohol dehydrogenase-like predicted oxidoreductase